MPKHLFSEMFDALKNSDDESYTESFYVTGQFIEPPLVIKAHSRPHAAQKLMSERFTEEEIEYEMREWEEEREFYIDDFAFYNEEGVMLYEPHMSRDEWFMRRMEEWGFEYPQLVEAKLI